MVKAKAAFCIILVCFLFGCATKQQEIKYVTKPVIVEVPVMQTPAIKPIPRPKLEIHNLNNTSTQTQVVEAYYNSIQQLVKYSKLLEIALEPAYRNYTNGTKQQ